MFKHPYNKSVSIVSSIIFFLVCSCSVRYSENRLKSFLDNKGATYEDISVQMGAAYWNYYSGAGPADLLMPKQRYRDLLTDEDFVTTINWWHVKKNKINDPITKRRVELWHNIFKAAEINYSSDIFNLQHELEAWLGDDSTEGKPSEEELETMALRLMQLRNEKAREAGYTDYAEMALQVTGLSYTWLDSVAEMIDSRTIQSYRNLIQQIKEESESDSIAYRDVRALIMEYYLNSTTEVSGQDSMLAILTATLSDIGISLQDLPVQIETEELPPTVGGQGIAIHIPNDFRTVLPPDMWITDLLHELGHGLVWMHTTIEHPVLKGYEWVAGSDCGAFSEGLAEVLARFTHNAEWRARYDHSDDHTISRTLSRIDKVYPAYIRFLLETSLFEIELYKNLDDDPMAIQNELAKKYLLLDVPLNRPIRLAKIMGVSYPVYTQSYLLGEVISWQIHSALEKKFGSRYVTDSNLGNFLKENLYWHGELYPWQVRLERVTGRKLDVDGWLKSYGL